ncbi:Zn(II)2Cys6 transcription factor domain-containing protein [Sporobolomyces koalae]|uniref:Zn(II)2Cys6 transcription factor domain-containing protein n=1 Tax=Sporobolomyces koalae TaxID=500713 RepID=UPI00316E7CCC
MSNYSPYGTSSSRYSPGASAWTIPVDETPFGQRPQPSPDQWTDRSVSEYIAPPPLPIPDAASRFATTTGNGRPKTVEPPAQQTSQWGFPPGGQIHLAAGIPDDVLPKHIGSDAELVKISGKSCASCRNRKVKCDRRYPQCARCVKRRETCDYGDDVSLALRPLLNMHRSKNQESSDSASSSPRASVPIGQNSLVNHSRVSTAALALPYPPRGTGDRSPERSLRTVSDFRHQLARQSGREEESKPTESRTGLQQLWDRFLLQSNLGESSSDWRLALPTMASSLTLHLLDASMASCCYHLPAFHVFNPHIMYYKQNIDTLDVASRAAVGILTSLGARASPHSALLGVAGPDIENGNASHELVLSAGVRRENAWRAIVKHATELCSKLEVMQVPSTINAQTLVAFVQMLMFAEVRPRTARFFLRAAIGIFVDMEGTLPPHEIDLIKRSVGVTLYESDARIAAWLSLPVLISEDDLANYFEGTGVHLVDLEREDLGEQLSTIFDSQLGPMSLKKSADALSVTSFYVCAVQRLFAKISSSKRKSHQFLSDIKQLWAYIDGAHTAFQMLTGVLRSFSATQDNPHHPAHHDLLIGLRMHERLLDVMNLSNEWLRSKRNDALLDEDRVALEVLLGVSNRRVRRGLKVLAFYAKVFQESHDKHVVYHLFTQLEAVQDWTTMVVQGENEVDEFGPLASQCVLTEAELDYFARALELSCFYTPLSARRLEEFTRARQARSTQFTAPRLTDYDLSTNTTPFPQSVAYRREELQFADPTANGLAGDGSFLRPYSGKVSAELYPEPAALDLPVSRTAWLLNDFLSSPDFTRKEANATDLPTTGSQDHNPRYLLESNGATAYQIPHDPISYSAPLTSDRFNHQLSVLHQDVVGPHSGDLSFPRDEHANLTQYAHDGTPNGRGDPNGTGSAVDGQWSAYEGWYGGALGD